MSETSARGPNGASRNGRAARNEAALVDDYARLQGLEREYVMLTRVCGVLVERLLAITGARAVEISDETIAAARGTRAWRDTSRDVVLITAG